MVMTAVLGSYNKDKLYNKKLYSNCLVLVDSRNRFERDLHKPKIAKIN